MTNDPWSGLLDPGERILWQGQPDSRIDLRGLRPMALIVGGIFCTVGLGIAGTGLVRVAGGAAQGLIPALFGLIFTALGVRAALGEVLIDAVTRSNTWYTLTDRRMLVAWSLFGRKRLTAEPLTPDTVLIYEEGPPGSVLISGRSKAGFRRIDEARQVYDLARRVQRGDLRAPAS